LFFFPVHHRYKNTDQKIRNYAILLRNMLYTCNNTKTYMYFHWMFYWVQVMSTICFNLIHNFWKRIVFMILCYSHPIDNIHHCFKMFTSNFTISLMGPSDGTLKGVQCQGSQPPWHTKDHFPDFRKRVGSMGAVGETQKISNTNIIVCRFLHVYKQKSFSIEVFWHAFQLK
jgi:hypothetical protein